MDRLYSGEDILQVVLLTGVIGGGAAALSGRAIARAWQPSWHMAVAAFLLGAAARFFHFALFEGDLLVAAVLCLRHRDLHHRRHARLASDARPADGAAISLAVCPLGPARVARNRAGKPHVTVLTCSDLSSRPDERTTMKKLSLGAIALLSVLATAPALADDIAVAVAAPMTGGQATFGRQFREGAEQAVADINAAGGVLGKKLRLEIGDDACDPKQARSVAEKLAGMGVVVAIGHYCSSSSIPASDAYLDGGVLQITPGFDQSAVHRSRHVEHLPHLRA